MRILLVSQGPLPAEIDRLTSEAPRPGWKVRHSQGLAKTTVALLRFRPDLCVLFEPGAATTIAAQTKPYVVWGPSIPAIKSSAARRIVTNARAVIVGEWSTARRLAAIFGSIRAVTVQPGLALADHPIGPRTEALEALGLAPHQRMIGLIGDLDDEMALELLDPTYRRRPGVGLLITGDGPKLSKIHAMSAATRPSSPVMPVGPRSTATNLITACASTIGIDLATPGPGPGALYLLAQGRRVITIAGEDATSLVDLYPASSHAVTIAEATADGVHIAIETALDAEHRLGPLSESAIHAARDQLDARTWARRFADVLQACA